MPHVPIPGALKALRLAAHLDRIDLAKKSGLGLRTIELWESENPPKTMTLTTLELLSKALECPKKHLAHWMPYGGGDPVEPLQADEDSRLPEIVTSTLSRLAEEERRAGGAGLTVTLPSGTHSLLGPTLFAKCDKAHGRYRDQRFAVVGNVKAFDYIPERACKVLRVKVGDGGKFMITRAITARKPFYATVFTTRIEHTAALQDSVDSKARVTVVVRVFDAPPKAEWQGFYLFEKKSRTDRKPPRLRPYAFVVEEVHVLPT
jgi:transcriptional regulator with XRE-family HTH domain